MVHDFLAWAGNDVIGKLCGKATKLVRQTTSHSSIDSLSTANSKVSCGYRRAIGLLYSNAFGELILHTKVFYNAGSSLTVHCISLVVVASSLG